MAEVKIDVTLPALDKTQSVEIAECTETTATAKTIVIQDAFANKNNSMFVLAKGAGTIVIKAGNCYPNSMLGDLTVTVATLGVLDFIDISRFENKDGSVVLDCTNYTGTVFAIAKRAGLDKV